MIKSQCFFGKHLENEDFRKEIGKIRFSISPGWLSKIQGLMNGLENR